MHKEHISLAAGVIIKNNNHILMVYEKGHWGLPKGEREYNESMAETAIREAKEETGLDVEVGDVAFVTEFKKKTRYYLQVYYEAFVTNGHIKISDPDQEIEAIEYISIRELSSYLTFIPRLLPLQTWLKKRTTGYHFYNLDHMNEFI